MARFLQTIRRTVCPVQVKPCQWISLGTVLQDEHRTARRLFLFPDHYSVLQLFSKQLQLLLKILQKSVDE